MSYQFRLKISVVIGLVFALEAHAETISSQDLVKALQPQKKVLTRSLNAPEIDPYLKKVATRQIIVETKKDRDRLKKAVVEAKLPSVAITVNFALDSAKIMQGSFPALNELGEALQDKSLSQSQIFLNGHTDASGSDSHNQELSHRRAIAVKNYLAAAFLVPDANLLAVGFGEEQLLNKANPAASENRRVEIINVGKY